MSYESYMREVLNYTPNYMQDLYSGNNYYAIQQNNIYRNKSDLENLYPDTYRKVYPLVCEECNNNTMPITEEILEQMVDNICKSIEIDLKIETNTKMINKTLNTREAEDRQTRQKNNFFRDLTKILIINELINTGGFPESRPPFPQGPRPPFPQGPARPPRPGTLPPPIR